MGHESIIIGLSPSCLRVGVRNGRTLAKVERAWLDIAGWDALWTGDLTPLDEPLSDLLRRVTHRPGPVVDLVYFGPHAFGEMLSVGVAGVGSAGWRPAAELALREHLGGHSAGGWTTDMRAFSTFTNESGGAGTQVMVVGDRDESLEKLGVWLGRCGCKVGRMIPAKAALLAGGARRAMELSTSGPEKQSAVLLLSEHTTVIAAGGKGEIKFVRSTDFGYGSLADAIVRAARALEGKPADGKQSFGSAKAYPMLFQGGLPKRGEMLDADLNLRGETVLPLIQPVLQRYVIETRQTLRFALDQTAMMRATLAAFGPGAKIPGLDGALSAQLEIPVERDAAPIAPPAVEEETAGELLFAEEAAGLGLVPPAELVRRRKRVFSASTLVGAGAALVAVACVCLLANARREKMEQALAAHAPAIARIEAHDATRGRAVALAEEVAAAQKILGESFGGRARWSAGLAEVSRLVGSDVQLTELAGRMDAGTVKAPILHLKGTAKSERGRPANADALGKFISRLSASALVESVELRSSREADMEQDQTKSFELAVRLRVLGTVLPEVVSQAKEQTP